MSSRTKLNITYEPERIIQPIYTGGDVALDANGKILATCLGEEVLLTEFETGQVLARIEEDDPMVINAALRTTLKPHTSPVIIAAIDRTGTLIATGGADGVIKVWDIRGGYSTHTFRGHAGVISALHFFEAAGEEPERLPKSHNKKRSRGGLQKGEDTDAPLDGTEKLRLATGGEDCKIRIWNLLKRKSIAILDSHVSIIRGIDYAAETHALISGSRDKTVIVWDARTWTSQKVIPVLEGVEAVGFLKHGSLAYAGGEYGRLRLWDTQSGNEITREQKAGEEADAIVHILRNVQLKILLTVHADQSLKLHSSEILTDSPKQPNLIDPLPVIRRISGTHDEIIDIAYVAPDRSLLALATNSEDIRLVSLATSKLDNSSATKANYFGADVATLQGHTDIIICLAVDYSGQWLVTGAKDNTARLWRIDNCTSTYEQYATFTGHAESIGAISIPQKSAPTDQGIKSFTLDRPPPFILTGSQDRTIKRWIVPKTSSSVSKALYTRKAHDKDINALTLSPNSQVFASASQDRIVKIWSVEEGETQGVLRGHKRGVWSVVFAPKDTPPIPGDNGSSTSSSRGLILTGSADRTLKIWSLNDYSCIRTLEGHTNSVLKVLWLPLLPSVNQDNVPAPRQPQSPIQIASAGSDGLVKIWDPTTSLLLTTLDNHTDRVWALAFNPTTRSLVSGGGDSVVTFWKDTSKETAAATTKAITERVEQDQELQNCVREGKYREAITLALQLNHPARLLGLFQNSLDTQPPEEGSISGVKAVDEVIACLSDEQLLALLIRVRDWNTNARTAPVAQRVLNIVVRSYSAERLARLGMRKGGKEVVEALRVYTERHYRRIEELWGESWVVEYLLGEMEQLGVKEGADGLGEERDQDMIMV
ncbi:MAG: hypothetical protein Q9163_000930 [Psora crenata]